LKYIDCHCHLADNIFYRKISENITDWKNLGIVKIGAMATNMKTTARILELQEQFPEIIIPSIGRHPWGAHKVKLEDRKKYKQLVIQNTNAIIGEVGLDYYFVKDKNQQETQKPLLSFFLQLAQKYKRSVMLHVTGAEKDISETLKTHKITVNVCCHWYSGPIKYLKELNNLGCYFSINPSFIQSKNHKKILEIVDVKQILTESDGPVKFQGKVNSPEIIPFLTMQIATQLKIPERDLAGIIHQNYEKFLRN
jgi:TatD DNase family protein